MLAYSYKDSDFTVILTERILCHLEKYKQLHYWDKEAGGQLFARFDKTLTTIEEITGPRLTDTRTRTSYKPDRRAEQIEISQMYKKDLHYVGDWHTHPSPIADPSGTDISNIRSCVIKSKHELNGFIMIIVGTNSFPEGLRVSVHTGQEELVLSEKSTIPNHN